MTPPSSQRGIQYTEAERAELAELLFPDVKDSIESFEQKYPPRNLPSGAAVTRFAPSPTGVMHIGGLFAALISERFAHSTKGLFFLRIEDTDKNREVESASYGIVSALNMFDVKYDEGAVSDGEEKGNYGPYLQSKRLSIYRAFAKELVRSGRAYPCFASSEELEALRKSQEAQKVRPGYYGSWAKERSSSFESVKMHLTDKKPFALRLFSLGSDKNQSVYNDLIKGDVTVTENDQDIVLLKSDGYPTYHFAHVVDDYLMRTTHVLRGDEWLSSLPIHLELFGAFRWSAPRYGHIAPILKQDGGSRRKLSKRKDPEAAVSYYADQGYPLNAVIEYLLNIVNSDFELWRAANPTSANTDFAIKLEKLSKSGALFDLKKLDDVSKNIVGRMSAEGVYKEILSWAKLHDAQLAEVLEKEEVYAKAVLGIERGGTTTRKDMAKYADTRDAVGYFFDSIYETAIASETLTSVFPSQILLPDIGMILRKYAEVYDPDLEKNDWFEKLKAFGVAFAFCPDTKEYKANPGVYKGSIADLAMIIRGALTTKAKTPDLHQMLKVMGPDRVRARLIKVADKISS